MPNPENLKKRKSFVKNDPRINRKGRPVLPDLKELVAAILGEEKDGKTAAEAILAKWRAKAAAGDLKAGELLFDRGWGKAKQPTEITGKDGGDLVTPLSDSQVDKIISALREK